MHLPGIAKIEDHVVSDRRVRIVATLHITTDDLVHNLAVAYARAKKLRASTDTGILRTAEIQITRVPDGR